MIKVLIAEDSPSILDALSLLVGAQPDLDVVGTARDGLESVERATELRPDVVIMDAQMPRMDGVEATKRLKHAFPETGVLFLSVFPDHMEAAVSAGSDGYLTKDCSPKELFDEIRRIAGQPRAADCLPIQ